MFRSRGSGDDLRETHEIRDVLQYPQAVWEVEREIEGEVRERGSADRPILARQRRQAALTARGGCVNRPYRVQKVPRIITMATITDNKRWGCSSIVPGIYTIAAAELGRKTVSKHQIRPEYGDEQAYA